MWIFQDYKLMWIKHNFVTWLAHQGAYSHKYELFFTFSKYLTLFSKTVQIMSQTIHKTFNFFNFLYSIAQWLKIYEFL